MAMFKALIANEANGAVTTELADLDKLGLATHIVGLADVADVVASMASGGEVQVGVERWAVTARELPDGDERDECWSAARTVYPGYDSYQTFTDRRIPVAVLERRAATTTEGDEP